MKPSGESPETRSIDSEIADMEEHLKWPIRLTFEQLRDLSDRGKVSDLVVEQLENDLEMFGKDESDARILAATDEDDRLNRFKLDWVEPAKPLQ